MIPRIGYGGRLTVRLPSNPRIQLAHEAEGRIWVGVFDDGRATPLAEVIVPLAELAKAIEVLSGNPPSP